LAREAQASISRRWASAITFLPFGVIELCTPARLFEHADHSVAARSKSGAIALLACAVLVGGGQPGNREGGALSQLNSLRAAGGNP
jgi:hypothetical protein